MHSHVQPCPAMSSGLSSIQLDRIDMLGLDSVVDRGTVNLQRPSVTRIRQWFEYEVLR